MKSNKKYILGLDISTSKIGFNIISNTISNDIKDIIKIGIIEPEGNNLFEKSNFSVNKIKNLLNKYEDVEYIFIEDSLKSFASGRTSADVKIKLITINNIIHYELWKMNKYTIQKFHPSSARKLVIGKASDRKRNFKKPVSKRYAMLYLIKKYGKDFYNSLPKMKTKDRLDKSAFDISDSLIISLAGQKSI